MEKVNEKHNRIENIVIFVLLIILAIIVGINRINLSDFNPINGDFQNYNPVRRFLEGQIPYKDFAVYLGTGHLIVLSIFQLIFSIFMGNDFTTSLFVSNMVTFFAFEVTVFFVSYLILKNKKSAFYITLFFALINIIRPKFIMNNINEVFFSALDYGIKPGVSARLIRMIIAPLSALLLFLVLKKDKLKEKHKIDATLLKKVLFAIIGGACILWSNDGGIATYISISFVYFLLLIKEHKKNIKLIIRDVLMYVFISIITFFILLAIVTRGHILSWFNFTLGVSSYQKWYYHEAPTKMNISLLNIDLNIYNVILIIMALYYIYKLFKSKEKNTIIYYAMLIIIILTSVISCYLYQFLSGGTSRDMIMLVLMVIVFSYIYKIINILICNSVNKKIILRAAKTCIIICAIATMISNGGTIIKDIRDRNDKVHSKKVVYIKELGGYFSNYGESINDAVDKIKDKKIFSTYASAIENVTDQFQPTGIDYIIHCMGDKQRDEYLNVFKEGNFDYVTTVDKPNVYSSKWIVNSNWFFYRELYKNYKPIFTTEYNVFWEKSNEEIKTNQDAKINKIKANNHTYNITVTTDDTSFSGVADLKLSYNSEFKRSFFKTLDINKYVYVKDVTGKTLLKDKSEIINYNIPSSSEQYYIPVTIINGVGKIQITTYPLYNTKLEINDLELVNVYDGLFKYCVLSKDKKIKENTLYIDNTEENQVILEGVKSIKIGNIEQKVTKSKINGKYIEIQVKENAEEFKYPNYFEVIK